MSPNVWLRHTPPHWEKTVFREIRGGGRQLSDSAGALVTSHIRRSGNAYGETGRAGRLMPLGRWPDLVESPAVFAVTPYESDPAS
jgi:hypothetical protein